MYFLSVKDTFFKSTVIGFASVSYLQKSCYNLHFYQLLYTCFAIGGSLGICSNSLLTDLAGHYLIFRDCNSLQLDVTVCPSQSRVLKLPKEKMVNDIFLYNNCILIFFFCICIADNSMDYLKNLYHLALSSTLFPLIFTPLIFAHLGR